MAKDPTEAEMVPVANRSDSTGKEVPPAKKSGLDAIVDDYRADMTKSMSAWEEGMNYARGEQARLLEQDKTKLEGIKDAQGKLKPPEAQALPEMPKVPSIKARDFLQGGPKDDPWHTMNNMVLGLGLLATMGASGKHPQTALSALAGAMSGWAQGDNKRAQDEWATYMAAVERAKNEQNRIVKEIEEKWKVYGANKELLSMQLGMWGAEHGLNREYIDVLMKQPEQALAKANFDAKMMQDIWNQTFKMTMFQVNNGIKMQQMANLEKYRSAMLAQRAETRKEMSKIRDMVEKRAEFKQFTPQMQSMGKIAIGLDKLEEAFNNIQREHPELIPKDASVASKWIADMERKLGPGNKDLIVIKAQWPEVIVGGWSRGFWDEKGMRAQVAFSPQLAIGEQLPPKAAMDNYFRNLRSMMRQSADKQIEAAQKMGVDPAVMDVMRMYSSMLGSETTLGDADTAMGDFDLPGQK